MSHYLSTRHILIPAFFSKKAPRQSRRGVAIARVSGADLYSARKGEADVIFTVYRHVFDQTAPQGFIELRDVFRQFLQRGDEPLELPPPDTVLPNL